MCHLEALRMVLEVKICVPIFTNHLVHLFSDNATAMAIFQAGKGKGSFIQACSREIWPTCTSLGHHTGSGPCLLYLSLWHSRCGQSMGSGAVI